MSVKYYCDICDSEVFEKEKSKFVCIGTMDDDYPYKYNYVCDSCAATLRDVIKALQAKQTIRMEMSRKAPSSPA